MIDTAHNDDEAAVATMFGDGANCKYSSHEAQWNHFSHQYNMLQGHPQGGSLTRIKEDHQLQQYPHRIDFQEPFSVQVDCDGLIDDWYLPAHVNIEYFDDKQIKSLEFYNCSFGKIPDSVWTLERLERLEVHGMEELTSLTKDNNDTLLQDSKLNEFVIDECYSLEKLPPLPDSLTSLTIKACHRMTFLPKSLLEARNLKSLIISNMMLPMGPSLPPTLQTLQINGSEIRTRKLQLYLSQASQLKSLRLSMCDINDEQLCQLWNEVLPLLPKLEKLNLTGNNIQSLSALVNTTTTTKTRLRALYLEANPIVQQSHESTNLLALIQLNPELCCLGNINWTLPLYQAQSQLLLQCLDHNFARILKASSSCPLGLWSNVLSTTTGIARCKNNPVGKASLLYNTLQGPAFVERLPHTYHVEE